MRTNTNPSPQRLETAGAWPEIVAALAEDSVQDVAARFQVPAVAIRAALRRTNPGKTRRVTRPSAQTVDEPLPPEPDEVSPKNKRQRKQKKLPTDKLIEPYRDQLGTVSDDAIAEQAGVSKWVVRGYRIRQGIAAYDRWASHDTKSKKGTSKPKKSTPRGPLLDHVWQVRFADGSERFAVADNLVDAARAAAEHGGSAVTAIERLGPVPEAD